MKHLVATVLFLWSLANAFGLQRPPQSHGENRLVCASNSEYAVTYAYDHRGRMVSKTLCGSAALRDENSSRISRTVREIKSTTYIWDDWNIIREIVREGDSVAVTDNIWGLDLDGTLQGAGGVGGLLAVVRDDGVFLPTYDANGNVSEYVTTNGEIVAHYDYSPFGEPLVASGPLATTFTHQFSTKPYCAVTGFSEYVYRKYRPNIGRWMSKDPIGNSIYPRGDLSARYSFAYFTGEGSPIFQAGNIGSYVYVLNRIDTHDFAGLFDCKFNDTLRKCARPREGYDPVAAGRVNGCGGVGKIGIPFIGELPIEEVPEDPALILLPYRWHLGITPGIPYELVLPAVSCPFTSACNGHDKCYWTCNSDRAKCDDDFRKGMNALCDECRKNFFWKYDPRGYIWLLWCKEVAFMYYLGVRTGGWYDFEKFAQKEACEDCCCDEGKR